MKDKGLTKAVVAELNNAKDVSDNLTAMVHQIIIEKACRPHFILVSTGHYVEAIRGVKL